MQVVPFRVTRQLIQQTHPEVRVEYEEADRYLRVPLLFEGPLRPPVVVIVGHIAHGKTTLLDTFQTSALAKGEAGRITQSIQAFHVPRIGVSPEQLQSIPPHRRGFTVIDTPGHQVFTEMRLHGQQMADVILILIALDEGLQSQTMEVVYAACDLKKPIVFAFNKVDLYSDPTSLGTQLSKVMKDLEDMKIQIFPVVDKADITKAMFTKNRHPAVCISGKFGKNLDLLQEVIASVAEHRVRGGKGCRGCTDQGKDTPFQAVIVESWKDPDGKIAVSTIVRSGVAKQGLWCIADRNFLNIKKMTDPWNHVISNAYPGHPVILRGFLRNGCPAAGTHVMQMPDEEKTKALSMFRAGLLWYIERFPKFVHLLRPEGMPTTFHHVGNFGQLQVDDSLEYRLEFGADEVAKEYKDSVDGDQKKSSAPGQYKAADPHTFVPVVDIDIVLVVDTWHSARMLSRQIMRLATEHCRPRILGPQVGRLTDAMINATVQLNNKLMICYRITNAITPQQRVHAEQNGVNLVLHEVFVDLLEFVKKLIEKGDAEWKNNYELRKRTAYTDGFVLEDDALTGRQTMKNPDE
eukprot:PhF_6_TR4480/c0_g2_i5/m.6158/K02519/infB, MTIF2; translation initiation factor IF-2